MKYYLKTLSILYLIGATLHALDLLDLRLQFSEMDVIWKSWTIYLAIFDTAASIGLWREKRWGVTLLILIALSQLVAYSGLFLNTFGSQLPLVFFHLVTLSLWIFLRIRSK